MQKRLLFLGLTLLTMSTSATDIIKEGQEYPLEKMKEQNQQIIKMVVKEISKTLPQKVDKYTNMTQIADKNTTLIYTFEINTKPKSDESVRKEDKPRMEKAVTKGVCQSSKRFLDSGITLNYAYLNASTKKELFTFSINQQKCKELHND